MIFVSMDARNRGTVIRREVAPKVVGDLPLGGIYAVGPFQTLEGARVCASGEHWAGAQSVLDFERIARDRARRRREVRL